jgi:hypothetical protein
MDVYLLEGPTQGSAATPGRFRRLHGEQRKGELELLLS